jgi:tellurite methyltransferase
MTVDLHDQFGEIDVYLFDQFLRGRICPGMRLLDAGCGEGRNLVYALGAGYEVFGCDADAAAVDAVRRLGARLAPHLAPGNFHVEPIEHMTFPDGHTDVVLANAVLHFAADDTQFRAMVNECWRVLRPGGLLFTRLASSIGSERLVRRWSIRSRPPSCRTSGA